MLLCGCFRFEDDAIHFQTLRIALIWYRLDGPLACSEYEFAWLIIAWIKKYRRAATVWYFICSNETGPGMVLQNLFFNFLALISFFPKLNLNGTLNFWDSNYQVCRVQYRWLKNSYSSVVFFLSLKSYKCYNWLGPLYVQPILSLKSQVVSLFCFVWLYKNLILSIFISSKVSKCFKTYM